MKSSVLQKLNSAYITLIVLDEYYDDLINLGFEHKNIIEFCRMNNAYELLRAVLDYFHTMSNEPSLQNCYFENEDFSKISRCKDAAQRLSFFTSKLSEFKPHLLSGQVSISDITHIITYHSTKRSLTSLNSQLTRLPKATTLKTSDSETTTKRNHAHQKANTTKQKKKKTETAVSHFPIALQPTFSEQYPQYPIQYPMSMSVSQLTSPLPMTEQPLYTMGQSFETTVSNEAPWVLSTDAIQASELIANNFAIDLLNSQSEISSFSATTEPVSTQVTQDNPFLWDASPCVVTNASSFFYYDKSSAAKDDEEQNQYQYRDGSPDVL